LGRQVGIPTWALDCTGEYVSLYTQGAYVSSFLGWIGCVLGHDLTWGTGHVGPVGFVDFSRTPKYLYDLKWS
jgi:hypothetical protein